MQITLTSPLLALAAGQLLALDDVAGACIRPRRGTVWITEEGRLEDAVVRPGEAHCVERQGRTLIQAFDPAWISIREDPSSGPQGAGRPSRAATRERLADLCYRFLRSRYY